MSSTKKETIVFASPNYPYLRSSEADELTRFKKIHVNDAVRLKQ